MALIKEGGVVLLKKPHACGGVKWEVVRIGADYKIRCLTCGRCVMLLKDELEKRIKKGG